jgi:hypothetical protein
VNIEGVPETISRADYLRLMESVGFTPANLRELAFRPDGIYATVMVLDDTGRIVVDGTKPATHEVYVRVVDK